MGSSRSRSQCQVSYRVRYYMGHAVHSTESSVPMYPNKNVELYKIANAVQCTMKYVWMSTELSMKAIQKLNVKLIIRRIVNTTGKEKVKLKCGFRFLEHANPIPMRPVRMFPSKRRDEFPILYATMFQSRNVSMFPSKSARLSRRRNVPMNHIRSVIGFLNRTAKLFIRRFQTESAEEFRRKFVMTDRDQVLVLVLLLSDLDQMPSSLSRMIPLHLFL